MKILTVPRISGPFFFIAFSLLIFAALMTTVVAAASSRQGAEKSKPLNSASQSHSATTTIVFVGDSLTEGYGVKLEEAYPALVEKRLREAGHNVKVINGGVSGSLSSSAISRVKWFLKTKPEVLVLALGANDALKGTPPEVVRKNLAEAIDLAQANNIRVVLAGIRIFSNFGPDYTRKFERIYVELAKEKNVPLIPFLLEGVALEKDLNLADMKHPNVKGHEIIARTVSSALTKIL